MSAPEAQVRRALAELSQAQAQMEALGRQLEILRVTLEDLYRARETLGRTGAAEDGATLLLPVGANSFVHGSLKDPQRVLIGIGSDVAIELTVAEAIERLDARSKTLEEAGESLEARYTELEADAQEKNRVLQELYEGSQTGGPG